MIRIKGKPIKEKGLRNQNIIWRYLDTAKFLDFLHTQTLFFTRADRFEDKYEGSFTKSIKHAIEESYNVNNIEFTYNEFKQRLRERVFINCWHKCASDSMAMWSLYGKSEFAVAITTTVGKLYEELERINVPYHVSISRVKYVKHWRDPELNINPYSNVFTYKVNAYEYEKEVRVIVDRFDDDFNIDAQDAGMALSIDMNKLLRSVVISPEAPEWFDVLIRETCEKYAVSAPVRRSKLAFGPY